MFIFERLIRYDASQSGITVETTLKLLEKSVSLPAKVDTGASYCILRTQVRRESWSQYRGRAGATNKHRDGTISGLRPRGHSRRWWV
jgi:hypothetical protein